MRDAFLFVNLIIYVQEMIFNPKNNMNNFKDILSEL